MKQVILSLFTAYQFSSAQNINLPPGVVPIDPAPAPATTVGGSGGGNVVGGGGGFAAVPAPTDVVLPPGVIPVNPNPATPQTTAASVPLVPLTPAPVAPTLPPAPTAPVAPAGNMFGAYGQLCAIPDPNRDFVCRATTDFASDLLPGQSPNFMKCDRAFDCCACASITCEDCNQFSAGPSGALGVKDITINGRAPEFGGAAITCNGIESCQDTLINALNVAQIECSGDLGCRNSVIRVADPVFPGFKLDCSAMASCEGVQLEVVIPGPPPGYACNPEAASTELVMAGIDCSGQESCRGAQITVRNDGCDKVVVDALKCFATDSCTDAQFNFIGDIDIATCDLGPSGTSARGLEKCFENLSQLKCPDPRSCAGAVRTLLNPMSQFVLHCGNTAACEGAQLTLEYNADAGGVTRIDGYVFSSEDSGRGATITVRNEQRTGDVITIEKIECSAKNACADATFVLGHDVSIWEVNCGANSCGGCLVKIDAADVGMPCDPKQLVSPSQTTAAPVVTSPLVQPVQTSAPVQPVVTQPAQPVQTQAQQPPVAPAPTPQPVQPQWVPIQ